MAQYRDGLKHPTHIWEAAAMHRLIRVRCRSRGCAHAGIFDPHALWWRFYRTGWDDQFSEARHRFYCSLCAKLNNGVRFKTGLLEAVEGAAEITRPLPFPPEREWKRFISRHRG